MAENQIDLISIITIGKEEEGFCIVIFLGKESEPDCWMGLRAFFGLGPV